MELKAYQRESLDAIAAFCDSIRKAGGAGSPHPVEDAFFEACSRNYKKTPCSSHIPYFCVRIPTGGGKTLLAAYATGLIARRLASQDYPLCLWVTPSTTIRDQTLTGLKTPRHPYREAFRESVHGTEIEIMTIDDALYAGRARYSGAAVVIVTTIQNYRQEIEEGRKIYRENGYVMDHFTDLPPEIREQLAEPDGRVIPSLANVIKLYHPVVIMDEAHNARTPISFDSLSRFEPMAVLELTATPQSDSNVLHAVSALQLKNEGMIKLPVELESRSDWIDVLARSVELQKKLENVTCNRYIRPIVLLQAQPKNKKSETHTVDAVKKVLTEKLNVPEEYIRIATGDKDELSGEDLRSENCPVRYVITVEKLREGWDCPFAYILGSIGNVATETAVEQLLGRVLRMPDAQPTGIPELDRAYAVVQSNDVSQTAQNLQDSLVEHCGFDKDSASDAFLYQQTQSPDLFSNTPFWTIKLEVPIDIKKLPLKTRQKIEYDTKAKVLNVKDHLTQEDHLLLQNISPPENHPAIEESWKKECQANTKLNEYAKPIRVPQMIVTGKKQAYLFDPIEIDEFQWQLDQCSVTVGENEFSDRKTVGGIYEIDTNERGGLSRLWLREVDIKQLWYWENEDWSIEVLARYLDDELHHGGQWGSLTTNISFAWILRFLRDLLKRFEMKVLVRKRHDLAKIVKDKIWEHAWQQKKLATKLLFDMTGLRRIETSKDDPYLYLIEDEKYLPYRSYSGSFEFMHHAFPSKIGWMNDEEKFCAEKIETHRNVKRWLRNLDPTIGLGGFSLPVLNKTFYPDFIAELNDDRIAIIEYKGGDRKDNPKELDKKWIGENWASHSGGSCVFVWVADKNWNALEELS
ncbi:MAG: DEAD/DEAH box helicase family protein [Planctomycetaceae bacterium]|jgi:type III restriction enzyme|nr:DEAD/DEAH box helicase family protein [Planctomycetaceae bacterium]